MKSIVLLMAASSLAFAAEKNPLPKDLPAYGELKPVPAPHVSRVKLDNGLLVWLVPEPGFPKVSFTLAVRGGYAMDPKDREGIADLIASVLSQGTKTRDARKIAEEMQGAGGDLSADASADSLMVGAEVLNSKLEPALQILADLAQNATFPDGEVELEKRNAASSLEGREAEPRFLGDRALYRALFGSHPYAVTSPTHESIAATTAADLRREYARRFRPEQALLVAVGDFDELSLTAAIRRAFGPWKSQGEAVGVSVPKPEQSVSRAVVYVPRPDSVQTAFYIGALGPNRADSEYPAMRVATAIYGGMFGSRLIGNIREDKGYTYSPHAALSLLQKTGVLMTSADVRNPVTGASYNEINYELNRMATTAPDEQELERAKRFVIGSMAMRLQSRASVSRSLADLWVDSLPPEELGLQGTKVAAVTAKDVEAAGRKYFPAWRMSVVAVGEEKLIKEELAPFGVEFQKAK